VTRRAPWVDDEDETLFPQVMHRVRGQLEANLQARLAALAREPDRLDLLLQEAHLQMTEQAARGNVVWASDLGDLILELHHAYEYRRQL
jgi:hypothetical protein